MGLCEIFRIREWHDFGDVKAGDIGGYVESEDNLSHQGNAWVADNAKVTGNTHISGNAVVYDNAWVSGEGEISGDVIIGGWAEVKVASKISGKLFITAARPDPGPVPSRF